MPTIKTPTLTSTLLAAETIKLIPLHSIRNEITQTKIPSLISYDSSVYSMSECKKEKG